MNQSAEDRALLTKAIVLAAEKHNGQTRKDGTAYIFHPMKVADILKQSGFGTEYQIAAVLHDILEDTDTTEEYLREIFPDEVVDAVVLCTKREDVPPGVYFARILENPIATAVKSADRIHNMLDAVALGNREFALRYLKEAEKYYEGKFCKAVDDAIAAAREALREERTTVDFPMFFSKENMRREQ